MSITIKDVARETNLAISTISKYINGGNVREENRAIIQRAIEKLGYTPNVSARGLRTSKSYVIGLMMGTVRSPHTAVILEEVEKKMRMQGYSLIFSASDVEGEKASRFIQYLLDQHIDGLIITPNGIFEEEKYALLRKQGIPIVILEENCVDSPYDCVQTNCVGAVYDMVEYLIQNGHHKISIIKGPSNRVNAQERFLGYIRAMQDYCYPIQEQYIISGDYTFESGYDGIRALWENEERPTAVVACNYDIAQGAMAAIAELNINVPEELSIIVFDDFELSEMVRPKLTAIKQPLIELADYACDLLMKRMQGNPLEPKKKEVIRLKATYMIRDSVKRLQ